MNRILFFALILLLITACADTTGDRKDGYSDNAKNPEDSLFQDVMDGHDEAMAKMGKLSGYRKQLDDKIDSIKKKTSPARDSIRQAFENASMNLKEAEDEMNKWMHEFSIDSAQDDVKRRIEYLQSEKLKVYEVRDEILSALAEADSLLRK